ncbi:neuronal pentraxin-1 isoform X2 [Seriola aureovittata]|uniref:neuronal pentraxin-1 isoform X2 n=1 Tax=Seriola aureovittata TaxID=2871759 RepID=UPI0024BD8BFB|nr:neuronal pentraxin-1 isoform X2 [Seriola aureovittata]
MEIMRNSQSVHLLLVPIVLSLLSLVLCPASASSGSDYDYGAHPRFVCTPIPVDADPSCFPTAGPGGGATGPGGPGHQSAPPAGWWGASEEAKATILHLRESLVQQKETILDQRETIRELTAKLTLCEGLNRGVAPHNEHHGTSYSHHAGVAGHHTYTDNGHHSNQQGHHGNLIPDSPHHPSVGGQRSDGGHSNNNHGKDKHVTPGDITSSPEQTERMLHALKERLENLQKRNTSITYSSSLKELLQRKINALEQQLHHHTAAHNSPEHHDDDSSHRDDRGRHDDDRHDDGHPYDRKDDHNDGHRDGHNDSDDHTDHHDDSHNDDHHERHGDHDDHDDDDDDDDDEDDEDDEDDDDEDHHGNEADSHSYLPHTGYRAPGPRTGFHSNKLESMLNQLHLTGSSRKKSKSPDDFQISFPMRTNYMYGRVKRTLLQEIFALTLCLWMKAGVGPSLGTPFSYSAPGQANELVLIEWGNNPIELLIDDKAVTLPLSVSDGKWHHVCVTWSTRDGQWEAYQDGVQRGSGINLSPWHPIKPGGVFILGQEQDTLGGRFDATQSFVGEMSEVHMWSHVLSASDIYSLASCSSHLRGDVIAWSDTEVELHGGVARYPFDSCH